MSMLDDIVQQFNSAAILPPPLFICVNCKVVGGACMPVAEVELLEGLGDDQRKESSHNYHHTHDGLPGEEVVVH